MIAVVSGGRAIRATTAAQRERSARSAAAQAAPDRDVFLLDYGAGNVRSVRNAITKLGYNIRDVERPQDLARATRLIFPGVGAFGSCMDILQSKGYIEPLKDYLMEGKPFYGICLGLQCLFEGSEESGGVEGLGIIPGTVTKFDPAMGLPVPHIGWNTLELRRPSFLLNGVANSRVYYVHSYHATPSPDNEEWVLATSTYGKEFVGAINKGNVFGSQFHPEKSGLQGLSILQAFLDPSTGASEPKTDMQGPRGLAKRVIACLDVRSNDQGDLVVTKGDQYDVREKGASRDVRNLGKPVELAGAYYEGGADEVAFLNITGFRDCPMEDLPMLEVMRRASERVFVPLTVGGGIKEFTDSKGTFHSALRVAAEYFRSGADKVSIGSDAVLVAEEYYAGGKVKTGKTSIEQISRVYGKQAVVVSIDPRRVWVKSPEDVKHHCVKASSACGPNGEEYCWWQCTIKGGREGRDIGAVELAKAVEDLGAGEILLNCIDKDGTNSGFELDLVEAVSRAVTIPVIASSGAGRPDHFTEVFQQTGAAAALAAGIFHRGEVQIREVKEELSRSHIPART